jgi:hypothetical protein
MPATRSRNAWFARKQHRDRKKSSDTFHSTHDTAVSRDSPLTLAYDGLSRSGSRISSMRASGENSALCPAEALLEVTTCQILCNQDRSTHEAVPKRSNPKGFGSHGIYLPKPASLGTLPIACHGHQKTTTSLHRWLICLLRMVLINTSTELALIGLYEPGSSLHRSQRGPSRHQVPFYAPKSSKCTNL